MKKLLRRILYWWRHSEAQNDLREEMEFHRLRVQQELERNGMPPHHAAPQSRRVFGNSLSAQEDSRAVWIWPWLERFWQDIRFGVRMIAKNPGFSAVAIISLGLGIGANTAIFTTVNGVYFNPIAVEDISTLYAIGSMEEGSSFESFDGTSFPNFEDLQEQSRTFSGVAASKWLQAPWKRESSTLPLVGRAVTANYFEVLGVKASLGRTFAASDADTAARNPAVILGHTLWVEQLGADREVIGKEVVLWSQVFRVIGIAPEKFRGMLTVGNPDQVWILSGMLPLVQRSPDLDRDDDQWIAIGRLKPGVTASQAAADLKNIGAELRRRYPADNEGRDFRMERLWNYANNTWSGSVSPKIAGLMVSSVVVVLIVVCLNLANLLLARGAHRQREFSVRVALGGSRVRLIRQLLTESILMSVIGAVGGVFIAFWVLWYLRPGFMDHMGPIELPLDFRVMTFIGAITLLAGVFFGLAPAFASTGRRDINPTLHGSGGAAASLGPGRQRLTGILLVLQIAFSIVMLISGALFIRVAQAAEDVDLGFDWKHVGEVSMNVAAVGFSPAQGVQFYRDAVARTAAIPGVEAAALACGRSIDGGAFAEDSEKNAGYRPTSTSNSSISPSFFSTLGVPLTSGRGFNRFDSAQTTPVAIVNRSAAERLWPQKNPVGQRFRFGDDQVMREVVGVVPDFGSFTQIPIPSIFVPFDQVYAASCAVRFRAAGDPGAALPIVRTSIQQIDPDVPIGGVRTIQDIVTGNFTKMQIVSLPLESAGFLTLALSVIGIYGVTAYSVAQRTQELGLRAALGARRRQLLWVVIWRGVRYVVIGVILGVAIAGTIMPRLFFSRLLMNGIEATDPLAYIGASFVVLAAGVLASYIPARRALRVDPVVALRHE